MGLIAYNMSLTFVSYSFTGFQIDTITQKAFAKVRIYYRRDDAPSILEDEQIHVSCSFYDKEPEWKIKYNIIKAAKNKLLRLEADFPRLIDNIFTASGRRHDCHASSQFPARQYVQCTHLASSRYQH